MAELATILWMGGDRSNAINYQARAVSLLDEMLGDHPDTALAHRKLAMFLHGIGQHLAALAHLKVATFLLQLAAGLHHREVVAGYLKMGIVYQDMGHAPAGIACFNIALARCSGHDVDQTGVSLHGLAMCYALSGSTSTALKHEKQAHTLYKDAFGEDDKRTKDSVVWMKALTEKIVQFSRAGR